MSSTENADRVISKQIDELVEEYEKDGWLTTPSSERKSEIAEELAKLRASLNPQSNK